MRNSRIALTAIAFVAVAAPLVSAPKSSTLNVTTTIYDYNGLTQLLMRSDDYNGATDAVYTSGSNAVTSQINSNGNWDLYVGRATGLQAQRYVFITPNQPVGGAQPASTVPIPTPMLYDNFQSHCESSIAFPKMGLGINYDCQLNVEFHYSGLVYKLAMGPGLDGPATGVASVVCNNVIGGQCIDWTIAPDGSAANVNVANLYYYIGSTATWVFLGQYYNTFLIHLTNP